MKESSFWHDLRTGIQALPKANRPFCHRIENSAGIGQPDVNLAYRGAEVWLELKVMKGNQIEVRHSQFRWLRERMAMGLNNTFFVARHKGEIKVWRGNTIYGATGPGRATDKSMIFAPPPADFIAAWPPDFHLLLLFLFDLLPKVS